MENNEKIGINVQEAAAMMGISKNLMADLVKYPDFPCIKFKRRIVINKNNRFFFIYFPPSQAYIPAPIPLSDIWALRG